MEEVTIDLEIVFDYGEYRLLLDFIKQNRVLFKYFFDKLVEKQIGYRCRCTDEDLEVSCLSGIDIDGLPIIKN